MGGGLVMMCGLSFSGKSTVARDISEALDARLISLDDINDERGLWGGHGIPVHEWQRTHEIARARTSGTLTQGGVVILDDTSNLRILRDGCRDLADACGARFALVLVDTPMCEIKGRMEQATGTGVRRPVSEEVFADHVASFEWPEDDEVALVLRPDRSLDVLILNVRSRLAC